MALILPLGASDFLLIVNFDVVAGGEWQGKGDAATALLKLDFTLVGRLDPFHRADRKSVV